MESIFGIIDKMIKENQKHMDEKGFCWLCYGENPCVHQHRVDVLNELKEKLKLRLA
jgi:hypothetical protein